MAQRSLTSALWTLPIATTPMIRSYAREVAIGNGAAEDLADDIAQITVLRLNDAATRNPAVLCILNGPDWRPHVANSARRVLAGHRHAEARRLQHELNVAERNRRQAETARDLEDLLAVLCLETLAVRLTSHEQWFLHLRYFLGKTVDEIAVDLAVSVERCREIGQSAVRKLERALLDDHGLSER